MPKPTRVLIIDDEPIACAGLMSKMKRIDKSLEIVTTTLPTKGLELIQDTSPDIVFLDISMPGMTGFDLLDQIPSEERHFALVFCTAHSEHAVKAFEEAALDYILKPAEPARLEEALKRAKGRSNQAWAVGFQTLEKETMHKLTVRTRRGLEFLDIKNILFFTSEAHETIAWLSGDSEFICKLSLTNLSDRLSDNGFVRIHRSCLVNANAVSSVDTKQNIVRVSGSAKNLPLSKRCKSDFLAHPTIKSMT